MNTDAVLNYKTNIVVTSIKPACTTIRFVIALAACLAAGCSSLLPTAETQTKGPWKSFDEAKRVFDTIEPGRTTLSQLKQLGYDPYSNANVSILNYSDVLSRFAPTAVRDTYLESGIRACMEAQTKCIGYSLTQRQMHSDRVGNFFLDFINFHRRTESVGWQFDAVIVVIEERIVHKVWSGQPAIKQVEETRNPLGPLQDQGASVIRGKL
jgi:hypothetical protein